MDLDEELSKLEEKVGEQQENAEIPPKSEQNSVSTIKDMSYGEVTEMAKKTNLVATAKDENFVAELSEKNKDVLLASIELEKAKVEIENLKILLEQERIQTEKEKSLNERLKDKYGSKLDKQAYYYASLKSILETVWIKEPMNVILMWVIATLVCLSGIYPLKLLFCATFGNLIAGASSDKRKGFAKGCLWSAVAVLGLSLTALLIYGVVKLGLYLF